jgi:uncharacterized protein (TIGR03083 family)
MSEHAVADRARVLASYQDALDAFRLLAPGVSEWDAPTPCGQWTQRDLAGHVLAVVRYWHRLLDAATAGRPFADLPRGDALAAMNAADLDAMPEQDGEERLRSFLELATAHRSRVGEADWTLRLGSWSGLGALSVGQHTGVAIGEWHVHAWDIARGLRADHRPHDAAVVMTGNRVLPGPANPGDDWRAVLLRYGRDPDWEPSSSNHDDAGPG